MVKKIAIGIIFIGALAAAASIFWPGGTTSLESNSATKGFVKEGEITFMDSVGRVLIRIDVEIASRPEERNQGLMYRDYMPAGFGMLFIFEQMAPRSFWMHNTPLPLDLIFLDDGKRIVSIQPDAHPYSDEPIPSGKSAMYVIEVNAGFCEQHAIRIGQVALF